MGLKRRHVKEGEEDGNIQTPTSKLQRSSKFQ